MSLRSGDVVVLGDSLGVGVVRYVGSLKNAQKRFAPMVGVELGTPIGNCDGRYQGKRHFSCGTNFGTFLPRDRVKKKLKPEDLLKKLNEVLESLDADEDQTTIENIVNGKKDDKKDKKKKKKKTKDPTKSDKEEEVKPLGTLKHKRMNSVSKFVVQKEKIESMTTRVQELEANNSALKDHLRLIAECTASLASINPFFTDLNDNPDVPLMGGADMDMTAGGAPISDASLPNLSVSDKSAKMSEQQMFDDILNDVDMENLTKIAARKGAKKRPSRSDIAKMDNIFRMSSIPRTPSLPPAKVPPPKSDSGNFGAPPPAQISITDSGNFGAPPIAKPFTHERNATIGRTRADRERGSLIVPQAKDSLRVPRSQSSGRIPLRQKSLHHLPGMTIAAVPTDSRSNQELSGGTANSKRSILERMSVDFDQQSIKSAGVLGDAFAAFDMDDDAYSDYQGDISRDISMATSMATSMLSTSIDPEQNRGRVAAILNDNFFNYLDFSSDNMVDIANFELAIRKFDIDETILSDHDLETIFRKMDTDRSGTIELQEFIDFLEDPEPDEIADRLIEHLEMWDANKEKELQQRRSKRREKLRTANISIDLRQVSKVFESLNPPSPTSTGPGGLTLKDLSSSKKQFPKWISWMLTKILDIRDDGELEDSGLSSPMAGPKKMEEDSNFEIMKYYYGRRLQEVFIPPNAPPEADLNVLPDKTLTLSHVFGYKGNVLYRNNLHILRDLQHMVYNTANIVVLHNMKKNSQVHFTEHEKEVTAVAVWPDASKDLIASGSAPNKKKKGVSEILVWDRKTRKVLRSYESDARGSVVALAFSMKFRMVYSLSNDENHTLFGFTLNKGSALPAIVAVASKSPMFGMAVNHFDENNEHDTLIVFGKNTLKYFDIWKEKKKKRVQYNFKWRQVRTSSYDDSVQEKAFHCCVFLAEQPSIYVVGGHTGHIYLCNKARLIHREPAHDAAVTVLTQTKRGFVSGSLDGVWQIWECDGMELKYLKKGQIAEANPAIRNLGAPRSMCYDPSSGDLIVGCRTNQILKVSTMKSNKTEILVESHFDQVTSVDIHPSKNVIATGSADEYIRLWDLDTRRGLEDCSFHSSGEQVMSLGWAPDGQILAVGLATSAVLFFSDTLRPMGRHDFRLRSDSCEVKTVVFSPNSKLLAIGFGSGDIIIVNIKAKKNANVSVQSWPKNLAMTAAVLDLQFSKDVKYLRAFSKDYEMMCWKLHRKQKETDLCKYKMDPDIEFVGKPLRSGWEVRGLYQHGYDGMALTACASSHNSELCVSGDRFGCVRLFKHPAVFPDAHIKFAAHSTVIMDACFSTSDDVVATVSADGTVMIWKIDKREVLPKFTRSNTTSDLRKLLPELLPGSTRKLTLEDPEPKPRKKSAARRPHLTEFGRSRTYTGTSIRSRKKSKRKKSNAKS